MSRTWVTDCGGQFVYQTLLRLGLPQVSGCTLQQRGVTIGCAKIERLYLHLESRGLKSIGLSLQLIRFALLHLIFIIIQFLCIRGCQTESGYHIHSLHSR